MTGRPRISWRIATKSERWSSPRWSSARWNSARASSSSGGAGPSSAAAWTSAAAPAGGGDEHVAHQLAAVLAEEHVLGSAEPDPLGAERPRLGRVLGRVAVRAHAQPSELVRPGQHLGEIVAELRLDQRDVVVGDLAGRPVDRDLIALREVDLADAHDGRVGVDLDLGRAGDARPAHPPRDERGVGGLAPLSGEDSPSGVEPRDVVGLGERAHEDDVLAVGGAPHRLRRAEHDRAPRRPGRGRDPGGQDPELVLGVEDRVQERLERVRVDRHQRPLTGQQAVRHGVACEPDGGLRRPLRAAGLQQVEPALLDRELDVLHVLVVGLEGREVVEQLGVGSGQALGEGLEVLRVAGARDHVLALGVGEEVAGRRRCAGALVAAERDPGTGRPAAIPEDHLLHVDRRAPVVGDTVDAAVGDRPLAVPGVEDRRDRPLELAPWLVGERLAGVLGEHALERLGQLPQDLGVELGVRFDPGPSPRVRELGLEDRARDALDDVAEHLHEPAIGVPGEALVVGAAGESGHRLVVQAQVEDRVEHPRHRDSRAGAHRDQEGVVRVAESLAGAAFERRQRLVDLVRQPLRRLAARLHVGDAGLGRDGESGRDAVGAQHPGHLGDVGALAAEQLALFARALGELVHPLHRAGVPALIRARAYDSLQRNGAACRSCQPEWTGWQPSPMI